jgi:hypothetical protein
MWHSLLRTLRGGQMASGEPPCGVSYVLSGVNTVGTRHGVTWVVKKTISIFFSINTPYWQPCTFAVQPIRHLHGNFLDVLADACAVASVGASDMGAVVTLAKSALRVG